MPYLHCHNCDWSQDDFWSKDYNPIRFMLNWEEQLLDSKKIKEKFPNDEKTYQEIIAEQTERAARRIRNMHYMSIEEYRNSDRKCPKCGKQRLDVD